MGAPRRLSVRVHHGATKRARACSALDEMIDLNTSPRRRCSQPILAAVAGDCRPKVSLQAGPLGTAGTPSGPNLHREPARPAATPGCSSARPLCRTAALPHCCTEPLLVDMNDAKQCACWAWQQHGTGLATYPPAPDLRDTTRTSTSRAHGSFGRHSAHWRRARSLAGRRRWEMSRHGRQA